VTICAAARREYLWSLGWKETGQMAWFSSLVEQLVEMIRNYGFYRRSLSCTEKETSVV
jgi:hypothetical protein